MPRLLPDAVAWGWSRAVMVVAGWLERSGRVLIAQRAGPPSLAGRSELPGGKVEPGETLAQALEREWYEELAVRVSAGRELGRWSDPSGSFTVVTLEVTLLSGEPTPLEHRALRWLALGDWPSVELLPSSLELFQPFKENAL